MTKQLSKIIDINSALKILNDLKIKNLEPEQIKKLFEKAAERKAVDEILSEAKISSIDINKEIEDFLKVKVSKNTRVTYRMVLDKWLNYCNANLLDPRKITPKDADLYASFCRDKYKMSATANNNVNAVSSFYKFLQRHYSISSPFVRVIRAKGMVKKKTIPTIEEIEIIKLHIPAHYWKAIDAMYLRGFRVGALKELHINSDRTFSTSSKGSEWTGKIPECLKLTSFYPFKDLRPGSLQQAISRACKFLKKLNKINHVYSVHDFRHFYACREYEKDKDIYRVMELLNHTNITTTQKYLKGLNAI